MYPASEQATARWSLENSAVMALTGYDPEKMGSWSFVFFLLEIKYEISPKVTKNPLSVEYVHLSVVFILIVTNFFS